MSRNKKSLRLRLLEKEKDYTKNNSSPTSTHQKNNENKQLEPVCPEQFTKEEKIIWKNYAFILKKYNLFTLINGPVLELLVKNISDRNKCMKIVKTEGICIESYRGRIYNPYWSAKNRCEENILKHINLLGLSNLGLSRLGMLNIEDDNDEDSEMNKLTD